MNFQTALRLLALISLVLLIQGCAGNNDSVEVSAPDEIISDTLRIADPAKSKADEASDEIPVLSNSNYADVLQSYWTENNERTIRLVTNKGEIVIRLFDETPIHSGTFLMLSKRRYFDGTYFTRVVPEFIIQGGSSDKEEIEFKRMAIGNYSPLPEFHPHLIHKRGAVSMARGYDNNPDKRSSPFNFFIVVGRTFNTPMLMSIGRDHDKTFSDAQQKIYREIGGAPHLDGEHTVFGEVLSGMEVVDEISKMETDIREWPLVDIEIIRADVLP
jgi:peptidyl-prolyl cis-trans isomerase A (cyclophilin A)